MAKIVIADNIRDGGGKGSTVNAGPHGGSLRRPTEKPKLDDFGGESKKTPDDFRREAVEREKQRKKVAAEKGEAGA